MLNKLVKMGILFDFYGKLLSKKQYLIIEFYYINDLSLGEIAKELDISRQAVYDTLKRAENKLCFYETTLGLVKKFISNKKKIKTILKYTENMKIQADNLKLDRMRNDIDEIQKIVLEILEDDQEVYDGI